MMEKCFVDSVCPPLRIQQAAVEIGHWFADNNIKHWELANCASRDSFEQLRQRVAELEKERDELKLVVSAHADFFSRTQSEMADLKESVECLSATNDFLTGKRDENIILKAAVKQLTAERDAALARLSEERDIWDRMLGDAADKFAHLEREIDDCLYVLDALWDKQCNKIVTQKWAEILIRNKRDIGALSAGDSCQQSTE